MKIMTCSSLIRIIHRCISRKLAGCGLSVLAFTTELQQWRMDRILFGFGLDIIANTTD